MLNVAALDDEEGVRRAEGLAIEPALVQAEGCDEVALEDRLSQAISRVRTYSSDSSRVTSRSAQARAIASARVVTPSLLRIDRT